MKQKIKKKNLIVAVVAIVVVVIIAAIAIFVVNKKDNKSENKPVKKVEKKKNIDIADNMIYYYSKFNYDKNKKVESIETVSSLESKKADFIEKYTYKDGKLVKISMEDNEYDEASDEMDVTYDDAGNMCVQNTAGYYEYEITNGMMFQINDVDTEAKQTTVVAKLNYDKQGRVTHVYTKDKLDVSKSKIIEYIYDEDSKITNITVTHPKRELNKNYKEDKIYDNLTVDFTYDDGIAIANVKTENNELINMFIYYYDKDGYLDYIQMCAVDGDRSCWLDDIHDFPGKELWNCLLDWPFNPIVKLP